MHGKETEISVSLQDNTLIGHIFNAALNKVLSVDLDLNWIGVRINLNSDSLLNSLSSLSLNQNDSHTFVKFFHIALLVIALCDNFSCDISHRQALPSLLLLCVTISVVTSLIDLSMCSLCL